VDPGSGAGVTGGGCGKAVLLSRAVTPGLSRGPCGMLMRRLRQEKAADGNGLLAPFFSLG
jgi:hypothetical protein